MTLSVSFSVVSNSLQPHGLYVAHQAPLSLGILQARILEWVSMPSSGRSSQPRDQNQVSFIASRLFTLWGTREAPVMTFSSVQSLSHAWLCDPMNRSTPGLPVHHQLPDLLKLMPIESVMPSSHLILCCPLLLLPPITPRIMVFSNESTLHMRWPKYWSFHFSVSPSNEHSGLISFRMDWLDLLAIQGTLRSLLQHHSSKASIL